jgi:hypothetical protein
MSYYVCCVSYNNDKCDRSTYTKEEQGMRVIFSYKNFKQYMGGGAEVEGGWTIYKITSPRVFHVRIETSPEKTVIPGIFIMSNICSFHSLIIAILTKYKRTKCKSFENTLGITGTNIYKLDRRIFSR